MTLIFLPIGLILPTLIGWLILAILQRKKRVLFRAEQWTMGCVLGLLVSALVHFLGNALMELPFNRWSMLGMNVAISLLLGIIAHLTGSLKNPAPAPMESQPLSRLAKILAIILGIWCAAKMLIAASVFLVLTPTYLDDTVDNWNLRAKVFFYDQTLTLVMPTEDPTTSPMGVSSYSPAVPLMKTSLAAIAGEWNDALVNSLHIVWYLAAMILLYYTLRRIMSRGWSLLGVYILASIPLYLMHGTNPYADAFVSVHVFAAVSMLFFFFRDTDAESRTSFMHIGAFAAGILPFTKNEGLLLYLPPLILILCIGLFLHVRSQRSSIREVITTLLWYGLCIGALALPWLIFKWSHGLTFGNAKSISGISIAWQEGVVTAWWINTFFEGNWLLLFALLIGLLIARGKTAIRSYAVPVCFFLIVYIGQMLLFLFTGLSAEALMQTGLARGVVQLLPVIVFITTVLLWEMREKIINGLKAIWTASV